MAKDFLSNYLPQNLLQVIDINTIEPQQDSFITKQLEEYFSDFLIQVSMDNRPGYLYFLFEYKSYPTKSIPLQLLEYILSIWNKIRQNNATAPLPIVIPLVLYHGQQTWSTPWRFSESLYHHATLSESLKVYVPDFEYILYDITVLDDQDIKGIAQLKILLTLFRDLQSKDKEKRNESIIRSLYYLNELASKETAMEYLETMMLYVFNVAKDLTKEDMEKIIHEANIISSEGSDIVMTLAEILRQEGIEIGIKKGIEKGIEKGISIGEVKALANTAIQLLTSKLGALPQDVKTALTQADAPTLQLILTQIFTIQNIDEVRRYL